MEKAAGNHCATFRKTNLVKGLYLAAGITKKNKIYGGHEGIPVALRNNMTINYSVISSYYRCKYLNRPEWADLFLNKMMLKKTILLIKNRKRKYYILLWSSIFSYGHLLKFSFTLIFTWIIFTFGYIRRSKMPYGERQNFLHLKCIVCLPERCTGYTKISSYNYQICPRRWRSWPRIPVYCSS